jgi:tetratricopeptide (TPR) repeat protein
VYFFLDIQRAIYFSARSLRVAERIGDGRELTAAASFAGVALGSAFGKTELAMRCFERARQAAGSNKLALGTCLMAEGMYYAYRADVEQASARFSEGAEVYTEAHEPMRLRQVWTMHAQAMCQAGRLARARALADKVWDLADGFDDHRGRGWARAVQGIVAMRSDRSTEAIVLLKEAVHFAEAGTDTAHQAIARSRLALTMALEGDIEAALPLAERAAVSCVKDRIMHPTNVSDGIFLALAAMAQLQRGDADRELSRRARWVHKRRRRRAPRSGYVYPMYLCGVTGSELVAGQTDRARNTADRAVKLAQKRGLLGELRDVHTVLARLFAADDALAAHHAREAEKIAGKLDA